MKLCAVVIWYNPDQQAVENILRYCQFCTQVYIIDNSEIDNSSLANQIPNKAYVANLGNLGIATALNKGCNLAFTDGFTWCMTMDQDSSWDDSVLPQFITLIEKYLEENIASFAPIHRNQVKSVVGDIKYAHEKDVQLEISFPDKVMTSGNIINLQVWNQIGKFNDALFIDEVDHEFCYRLWEAGYKVCEFPQILMLHTLGNTGRTLLPRPCKHSGVRLYYISRNMLYIKTNFPKFYNRNGYKKYMMIACIQKILEGKWSDISFIRQGIKAAKKGQFGSYQPRC